MLSLFKLKFYYCKSAHSSSFRRALSTSRLKDYYALLNVDKTSSPKQIKDSFLKLSKVYHPDNKLTGSHLRFVKLKEAYDAIKDGPPTTSQSYSTSSSSAGFSDPYADLSHRAHAYYRERQKNYTRYDFDERSAKPGFGGPYAGSKTPWEDLIRDREYKRRKHYGPYQSPRARPLVSITLIISGIAWFVIWISISEIWSLNSEARNHVYSNNINEYKEYKDYLQRKKAERAKKKPNKPPEEA